MYASVHSVTNSSAVVDWSRPSDPNGVILGYHLHLRQAADNRTQVTSSCVSSYLHIYTITIYISTI